MIKRHICNIISICMIFFVSPALFSQLEYAQKIQEIKERGYIIVGMTAVDNYPFYYTLDTSKVGDTEVETNVTNLAGIDIDIALEIAARLDVALRINREAPSFDALIPLVVERRVDLVISKLSRTLDRSKKILYSDPYIVLRQALFLNRVQLARANIDNNKLNTLLKSFSGTLGVVEGSSYVRYAKSNFPFAKIELFDTWEEVVNAALTGSVFAIYRDEVEIFKVIQENANSNLVLKPVLLKDNTDPIAIAVHPNEYHFLFFINRVLETIDLETDSQIILQLYKENK